MGNTATDQINLIKGSKILSKIIMIEMISR